MSWLDGEVSSEPMKKLLLHSLVEKWRLKDFTKITTGKVRIRNAKTTPVFFRYHTVCLGGPRDTESPKAVCSKSLKKAWKKSASLTPKSLLELDILLKPLESDPERGTFPCCKETAVSGSCFPLVAVLPSNKKMLMNTSQN